MKESRRPGTTTAYAILLALLLGTIPSAVQAQTPNVTDVAAIHFAGPDLLLLDRIQIDGRSFFAYIAADEEGRWRLTNLEPEDGGAIPDDVVLDLAELSVVDGRTLAIRHIFLDGTFYSGTIRFDEAMEHVESYSFAPSAPPDPVAHPILSQLVETYGLTRPAPAGDGEAPASDDVRAEPENEPQSIIRPTGADTPWWNDPTIVDAVVETATETADEILGTLHALSERVDRLDGSVSELRTTVEEGFAAGEQMLAAGERKLDQLFRELAAARAEVSAGFAGAVPESGSRDTGAARSVTTVARRETLTLPEARVAMTAIETIDLSDAEPLRGRWTLSESEVAQTDPAERFAKLRLPYRQDSRPRLYRLIARSVDPGWAGVGLHFSVEGVEHPAGYGHGESILVWLTRDETVYGTQDTFLEIYRSFDDVDMTRIAQARTSADLARGQAVEVLFDPGSGFVTVAVNGVEHVRYRLEYPAGASAELALRTLGRGVIRHLEVRSFP